MICSECKQTIDDGHGVETPDDRILCLHCYDEEMEQEENDYDNL